jgi:hypothetical protein
MSLATRYIADFAVQVLSDTSTANHDHAIFAGLPLWDNFPTLTLCRDFTNIIFQNVIVFKNGNNHIRHTRYFGRICPPTSDTCARPPPIGLDPQLIDLYLVPV